MYNNGLPAEAVAKSAVMGGCDRNPTMTERLHMQRDDLKNRLTQVEEAIDALESNPEVARAVDAISKVGGLY